VQRANAEVASGPEAEIAARVGHNGEAYLKPLPSRRGNLPMRWLYAILLATGLVAVGRADEALDYFEREVRPVLVDHCQKCHGPEKQESDLRLDSREALLQGGVSGPAIEPEHPEKSLLMAAIRHEGEHKMPPNAKLSEAQIATIGRWIKLGAPWPKEQVATNSKYEAARKHWAFQPVRDPEAPRIDPQPANPLDAFVRARLATEGLSPSPAADRRTLIRRLSFDLLGLPPTAEEVEAFVADADPQAYEKLVDRLLESPHYGEQWARHWLDVARYSDTKGYVYAREQRMWVHAWNYRDWVVQAFNNDMPYDRFLLLQLAADQATDDKSQLAAMGFLTLGRRFLGVTRDIMDDRIDVVTRGTLGLTVACARCHDHKYDPIPTRDYYSLYGVFHSSAEQIVTIAQPDSPDEPTQKYLAELNARRQKLEGTIAQRRKETSDRIRARATDYLAAQLELHKYPEEGFDQILAKSDLLPTFVHRWQAYLADAEKRKDPVFTAWHAYAAIPAREFAGQAAKVTEALSQRPAGEVHPLTRKAFETPPASMQEVVARYGALLADVEKQWQEALKQHAAVASLTDPAAESLRAVLYAADGPCEVPNEPIVNIEYYFDSDTCNELWKLQNEFDNWTLQSPPSVRHAAILVDKPYPYSPRVFKRGNPATKGEEVPRQFVEIVAGQNRQPFSTGSGRLELAKAIIDPANPLTARVMVNRVWQHHFGTGLVASASDFGTRAGSPSHPELLDWLATRFIEDGWSLKKLHRRILNSETYRQASSQVSEEQRTKAMQVDPENRLLWRMNDRRLRFEEMRDALLATTGRLDRTLGGRASDLFSPHFARRSLYGLIDRQFVPSTLRVFDFANPDLHVPQRSDTTVPQQALYFLNHPLMIGHAQALAAKTAGAASPEARVQAMYRLLYQRAATAEEVAAAAELVTLAANDRENIPPTAGDWQYGYGGLDEKQSRVASFEKLPHFTGGAWQGGPAWPDAKLGWVQVSAVGGHPGNDLAHAAIRRFVAPRAMKLRLESTLTHEPAEGEGVRGFVVHSRLGPVKQAAVHHGKAELSADELDLQAGDTLDFVADIGNKLSHNQFLWTITLTPLDGSSPAWDSKRDFENQGVKRLDPWEQLAQVLLSANEFVFVD
jgi:mono/diheme cytochrome c family protein